MNAIRPIVSQDPAGQGQSMPDRLAEIGARVAAKLDELQVDIARMNGPEADSARRTASELQALVAEQLSIESRFEQGVERRVTDRTQELSSLCAFLQTHTEREKGSLAREIHDALGGILTPAKMDLAWLESRLASDPQFGDRIRRLSALIDQGIDFKRKIIEALRPSLLDHLGLASALSWYVDEACREAHIEARLKVSERLERLPPDLEIALYRLVQESVSNIVKHSKAEHLDLTVERTDVGLHLVIADDGVGMASFDDAKRSTHGFAGMMHRVRSVSGTFKVKSQPNEGTRIDVFVPLASQGKAKT